MSALGFVQKQQSRLDRRVFHVSLTPASQELIAARRQALHVYGQFIQSVLSEEEARQFEASIAKITQLSKDQAG